MLCGGKDEKVKSVEHRTRLQDGGNPQTRFDQPDEPLYRLGLGDAQEEMAGHSRLLIIFK